MRRITASMAAPLAAAALALVAGCGGGPAEVTDSTSATDAPAPNAAPAEASESSGSATETTANTEGTRQVARTDADVDVFDAPGDDVPTTTLPAVTDFGSPRALLVVADDGEWLQVALPVRPNGSTGWIRRADAEVRVIDESIVIDVAERTLTLLDGDAEVLTTPVAVGTDDNPTPTGRFYVVDKLDTGDPSGPYGQFAFGLSAHSEVLTEFAGGDGQVGIHGTNDPSSIGQAVSHGCVRVPPAVAERLAEIINLGTPVAIS